MLAALGVADHALATPLLPFGEHVALAGERVLAVAEFDADRGALEPVALAEEVFEVATIRVVDVARARAVDHDGRRVAAARMREAQLRRVAAYQRRLVGRVRGFDCTGQFGGRELACRRGMRAVDRLHEFPDAGA